KTSFWVWIYRPEGGQSAIMYTSIFWVVVSWAGLPAKIFAPQEILHACKSLNFSFEVNLAALWFAFLKWA
uniref:Uncharacterized protein n=1 Tax=Anser brachyrhynchus TaxID=132585 RepID=A0A8B9BAS0_9AVES